MLKKIPVHVLMFDIACNSEIMPIIVDNVLPLEDSKPICIDRWWSGKKRFPAICKPHAIIVCTSPFLLRALRGELLGKRG